ELQMLGQSAFVGEDGRTYEIRIPADGKTIVDVYTIDAHGTEHPVLQGELLEDGRIAHRHDEQGRELPYVSSWASRNLQDSPLVGAGEGEAKGADTVTVARPEPAAEEAAVPAEVQAAEIATVRNADGSETRTYPDQSSTVVVDGKIVEATAADGRTRK